MQFSLVLTMLFALALISAPVTLPILGLEISGLAAALLVPTGIILATGVAVLLTITHLYVKTRASEAFVRTGMGGLKVIKDGGAIVLPVIHQIVKVTLETIRLEVSRKGADSLITSDKLRADIKAEFFVRVQPDDGAIQNAARSLGDKMMEQRGTGQSAVASLIEDKLVSALRTAAARKTLEQLNSERDEFLREVINYVTGDLQHNGFTLETVTISTLDQTDEANLKANNIFDAQGMRTIAEITQLNLTEKNRIVREGEQARQAQDVTTRQKILELDRVKAEAEAQQAAQVAVIRAEQTRLTEEKQIDAQRQIQIAKVEQVRALEIAERERSKAITAADEQVEVAKRGQQEAIARAEGKKAIEEAKLADAEAKLTEARQGVITAEQLAAADRERRKAIIAAEAEAERLLVGTQKAADGSAYQVKAEADARKASADAEAEAIQKKAKAESEALTLRAQGDRSVLIAQADGERAKAMVPVDVAARQVEIEQRRVNEVLKPELEARATHGQAAQEFELAQLRIEAEKQIRIELARAQGQIYSKITANLYGTPEDVARMSQAFGQGAGLSQTIDGFLKSASEPLVDAVTKALNTVQEVADAASKAIAK